MSNRPVPPYLALVPAAGKRSRRPKRQQVRPLPSPLDIDAVEKAIRQAEFVQSIIRRIHSAVEADDKLVVAALMDRLQCEADYAIHLTEKLRERPQ